ncbi:MAG TPA: tryptophan 7-halogenase [Patescibacteria group bacterium]|nr:tryptophan 7-halogenase [Patescibacteria group bacterium]
MVDTVNEMKIDVLVMGGGVTGQLAAAYLRMRFPQLRVAVVEGPRKDRPIVGESLVEASVDFLLELGLGPYLVEKHYPKYGLTYYFKLDIDRPSDRTYVVDEIPTAPPLLSFQINRFTFDRHLRERNRQNGVELIDAVVAGVTLASGGGLHAVTVRDPAGRETTLGARWLIDATGRNRLLAKQLQLHQPVAEQKNVFWFRLADFNPEILSRIQAIKREHRAYVPYFATHHFFGRGNWIWCIPMRSENGRPLMSIGITSRSNVYPHGEIRTIEQFLDSAGREHEVIAELVRSGTVVDTNVYRSYMWECRQRYSPDRWYILGDAADTVDPLYSVGLALTSLQIRQVGAIIQRELDGHDTAEFTRDLDTAITAFQRGVTRDTGRLYECMHDPYQCHLRIHLVVSQLFHLGLPVAMNGYLWDPAGAKIVNRFASLETLEARSKSFQDLIGRVAANPASRALGNFIKVQTAGSMNYSFYEHLREEDIPASLSHLEFRFARLRLALLAKLGWRAFTCFRQQRALAMDLLRGLSLLPFHGTRLRKSRLLRILLGLSGPANPRKDAAPDSPGAPEHMTS